MDGSERRQITRYNIRTPLRFRAINLTADKSDHFTEALNVSRGGFYFASSAPLQIGTPIEATLRMPAEVTGTEAKETKCTARVVHVKNQLTATGESGSGLKSRSSTTSSFKNAESIRSRPTWLFFPRGLVWLRLSVMGAQRFVAARGDFGGRNVLSGVGRRPLQLTVLQRAR